MDDWRSRKFGSCSVVAVEVLTMAATAVDGGGGDGGGGCGAGDDHKAPVTVAIVLMIVVCDPLYVYVTNYLIICDQVLNREVL